MIYMKKWYLIKTKPRQEKIAVTNLENQNYHVYCPWTKINNKIVVLFPGYIFIYTSLDNYATLQHTIGIKNIIKFGNNISFISNEEIISMQEIEDTSKIAPVARQIQIGKNAFISRGSLKGSIVKICSLPSRERVNVLLSFLGSMRRVNISMKNLTFS